MIFRTISTPSDATAPTFAPWRIATWLVLLFAAFGCLFNARAAQATWTQLQSLPAGSADASKLYGMLAWDVGSLVVAFVMIVLCAAAILRQVWVRPVLRMACVVLSALLLFNAVAQIKTLVGIAHALTEVHAQPPSPIALQLQAMIEHLRTTYALSLGLGLVAIIVLLWLAWQLGRPVVMAQFRTRQR